MKSAWYKWAAVCWLATLLIGCQSIDLNQPADWLMKGRLIVKTPEQAQRLSVTWRQFDNQSNVLFTGPLGTTIAKIQPEGDRYKLEQPRTAPLYAESLSELLGLVTGGPIPVENLLAVLRGEILASDNGEWRISVSSRDELGLPNKLLIESPQAEIKLTVTEWR